MSSLFEGWCLSLINNFCNARIVALLLLFYCFIFTAVALLLLLYCFCLTALVYCFYFAAFALLNAALTFSIPLLSLAVFNIPLIAPPIFLGFLKIALICLQYGQEPAFGKHSKYWSINCKRFEIGNYWQIIWSQCLKFDNLIFNCTIGLIKKFIYFSYHVDGSLVFAGLIWNKA